MQNALVQLACAHIHMPSRMLLREPNYHLIPSVPLTMVSIFTSPAIELMEWLLLVAESPNVIAEGPKNRYERLENRISQSNNILWLLNLSRYPDELETLLRQREQQSEGSSQSPPLSDSALQTSAVVSRNSNGDTNLFLPQSYPHGYTGPSPSIANTTGQFDQSPELFAHMNVVPNNESNTPSSHSGGYDIVWSTWPPNLPPPSLLRHLWVSHWNAP